MRASNATKIGQRRGAGDCEMTVCVPAAAQRRLCAESSASRATLTALAHLGEAAARAAADGAISTPRKRTSAGAADGANEMRRYDIPEIDRARIRDLRTVYAEALTESERDAIVTIVFRGAMTRAESEWVMKTHAELSFMLNSSESE